MGNELEYYINTGTAAEPKWVKITELLSWESSAEPKTYEPAWLDRKVSPTFVQGRTCSITWTKDTVKGGELEAWAMEHRNETDVACDVCRVFTWLGTATAQTADKARVPVQPFRSRQCERRPAGRHGRHSEHGRRRLDRGQLEPLDQGVLDGSARGVNQQDSRARAIWCGHFGREAGCDKDRLS